MPKIKIGNKIFEITKEDFEKDEIVLEFTGTLRTTEEEATFVENHKKDARKEGLQIALRTKADELGLSIDGSKRNLDDVLEAVKKKAIEEAKIEPNEQVKKLQDQLTAKESALQNALKNVTAKETEFNSFKNQSVIDSTIDGFIPDNIALSKADIKLIIKNKMTFDVENGQVVVKDAQGNIVKNPTTADVMPVKDVLDNFFKDNQTYLKPVDGGRGEGDSKNKGNKQSLDDFIKEQQDKGVNTATPEFQEELNSRIKNNLVDVD
jgi:DNA-binding transcriptional MerR regulator